MSKRASCEAAGMASGRVCGRIDPFGAGEVIMERSEVERVVRGAYAARRSEDVDAVLRSFAEDAT